MRQQMKKRGKGGAAASMEEKEAEDLTGQIPKIDQLLKDRSLEKATKAIKLQQQLEEEEEQDSRCGCG